MSQIVNDNSLFAPGRSPANTIVAYEDFLGGPTTIASNAQVGSFLRATTIGAGSSIAAAAGLTDHPGIVACACIANENAVLQSVSSLQPGVDAITLEASIRVTAAGAADTAGLGVGLGLDLPAAVTARASVVWQRSTNSWLCQTANGAAVSTAVIAGQALSTWYSIKIVLNSTQCEFYIDGALVATLTTTLPTSVLPVAVGAFGSGGTGTGTVQIDYVSVSQSGLSR